MRHIRATWLRPCFRIVMLFLLPVLLCPHAFAQSDGYITNNNLRGVVPFGSYEFGQIDQINLATGAVNLNIPLFKRKGRGMDVAYSVVYSSKFWVPFILYDPNTGLPSQMDWEMSSAPLTGAPVFGGLPGAALGYNEEYYDCQDPPGNIIQERVESNFMVTLGDGSNYRFPNEDIIHDSGVGDCPNMTAVLQTLGYSDSGVMELDTSGSPTYVLRFKDGRTQPFTGSTIGNIEDTNGNLITLSGDTIGRTYPISGTQLTVKNSDGNSESYTFSGTSSQTTTNFPTTNCGGTPIHQGGFFGGPTALTLPNTLAFGFSYDPVFGEITQVNLPTGGYIKYVYGTFAGFDTQPPNSNWLCALDSRRVVERDVSPDGTTVYKWTYSYANSGSATTTVTDPFGNVTIHTFASSDAMHETQTQIYQGSSTLLRTVSNTWANDNAPVQTDQTNFTTLDYVNWRITDTKTTLNDSNLMNDKQTDYDSYTYL